MGEISWKGIGTVFKTIKQWWHARQVYKALGIPPSALRAGKKFSASGVALRAYERMYQENQKGFFCAVLKGFKKTRVKP